MIVILIDVIKWFLQPGASSVAHLISVFAIAIEVTLICSLWTCLSMLNDNADRKGNRL